MRQYLLWTSIVLCLPMAGPSTAGATAGATPQGYKQLEVLAFGDSGTCYNKSDDSDHGDRDKCPQFAVARAMLKTCLHAGCDMGIIAGDVIYEDGPTSADDPKLAKLIRDAYYPLWKELDDFELHLVMGNHDVRLKNEPQIEFYKEFADSIVDTKDGKSSKWIKFPDATYTIYDDGSDTEFFIIDSNAFNRKQSDELRQRLQQSNARWKVVVGHHHMRTHNVVIGTKTPRTDHFAMVTEVMPLVCAYADLYVSGHEHRLGAFMLDCGVPYVMTGAGGRDGAPPPSGARQVWAWGGADKYGFTRLLFDEKKITARFYGGEHSGKSTKDMELSLLKSTELHREAKDSWQMPSLAPALPNAPVRIVDVAKDECIHSNSVALDSDHKKFKVDHEPCSDGSKAKRSTQFHFVRSTRSYPGSYKIKSTGYADTCLHASRSTSTADGEDALVRRRCDSENPAQYFDVVPDGSGRWYLKNRAYSTCIHSDPSSDAVFHGPCRSGLPETRYAFEYKSSHIRTLKVGDSVEVNIEHDDLLRFEIDPPDEVEEGRRFTLRFEAKDGGTRPKLATLYKSKYEEHPKGQAFDYTREFVVKEKDNTKYYPTAIVSLRGHSGTTRITRIE